MKTQIYWTAEEIEILNQNANNISSIELSKLIPNHSIDGILNKCKRLKLYKTKEFKSNHGKKYLVDNRSENWYQHHKLDQTFSINDLDNETYQVLIGSLLGDGGICKQSRGNKYLFKECHGVEQKDYLEWKRDMLLKFIPSNISCKKQPMFSTPCHPIFKQLRGEWYNEKECRKAYIPLKYIKELNALGLLVWYLDDGDTPKCPNINSVLFEKENLEEVVKIINTNLCLSLSVKTKSSKWRLEKGYKPLSLVRFYKEDRDKVMSMWCNLIDKYNIPKCMWYKIKPH